MKRENRRSKSCYGLQGWHPSLEFSRHPRSQENAPRLQQELEV